MTGNSGLLSCCGGNLCFPLETGISGFLWSCNRGVGPPLELQGELKFPLDLQWKIRDCCCFATGDSELLLSCSGNSVFPSRCSVRLKITPQPWQETQGSCRVVMVNLGFLSSHCMQIWPHLELSKVMWGPSSIVVLGNSGSS